MVVLAVSSELPSLSEEVIRVIYHEQFKLTNGELAEILEQLKLELLFCFPCRIYQATADGVLSDTLADCAIQLRII